MARHLLPLVLLTGCGAGNIAWESGDDKLHTALYIWEDHGPTQAMTLFLSNGRFECELPDGLAQLFLLDSGISYTDPDEAERAVLDFATALYREDARHVVLTLYKQTDGDWTGRYPGNDDAQDALISDEQPQLASGQYLGVDDAIIDQEDGVVRTYLPSAYSWDPELGDGGFVQVDTAGTQINGSFGFPDAHLSGQFTAEGCGTTTELFDAIEAIGYFSF